MVDNSTPTPQDPVVTPPVTETNLRRFGRKKLALGLVAVLILLGASGWLVRQAQDDEKDKKPASSAWAEYKSEKYGLKFSYLKSWGAPAVTEYESDDDKHYNVSFGTPDPTKPSKSNLSLTFSSDEIKRSACPPIIPDCAPVGADFTKQNIERVLSGDKSTLVKYDSTSYAIVSKTTEQGGVSALSLAQTVSLPKINVSAVQVSYSKFGDVANCPPNKLAPASSQNCVNQTDYDTLNKLAKSIKSLPVASN